MSHLKFFGKPLPYLPDVDYSGVLISIEGTDGVGRSTQIEMLKEWLELRGYGVIETGWSRSQLVGEAITQAKEMRALNRYTYSLIYAADFADRLEKSILPALQAGFVVLADRYVFTAFARDTVRGADAQWVRDLFSFAPVPHLVMYLKAEVDSVIHRVISRGPIDPFEAGLDIGLGGDLYDCFKAYQTLLIDEYNKMAEEFKFHIVNGEDEEEAIQERLRSILSEYFSFRASSNAEATGAPSRNLARFGGTS